MTLSPDGESREALCGRRGEGAIWPRIYHAVYLADHIVQERTKHLVIVTQPLSHEAQANPYKAQAIEMQTLPHRMSYAKEKSQPGIQTGVGVQRPGQMAIIPPRRTGILKKLRDSLTAETSPSMGKIPSLALGVSSKAGYPELGSNRQQGQSGNLQEVNHAGQEEMAWQKGRAPLISHTMITKPANLIFKKPAATQGVVTHDDLAPENKKTVQVEKSVSTRASDSRIENFQKKTIREVNLIADQVYKLIEKRIAIEKERRGRL